MDGKLFRLAPLVLALACTASDASTAAAPPTLRLPSIAKPRHHALELTIVPTEPRFSGSIVIDVDLAEATSLLWLNASELDIGEIEVATGGASAPGTVVPGGDDFVGVSFPRPIGPGRASLRLTFTGAFSKTATHGLFVQKEHDDWYAFSQFEAIDARRAFPCFDEPSAKAPWQLTLHVKKDHVAVSNTRIVSQVDEAGGMKKVVFAETPPLPSYLVAMAVGPFDVVDGGTVGRKRVPFRVVTPHGLSDEGRYAVSITPEIVARLEKYFGTPYPFEKLDEVTIPQTVAFGAMENPGMVTYAQSSLLSRSDQLSVAQKRGLANTTAHELAHQWFGDLVTLAWWDDTWLNEGFASWMASKIVAEWKPEWGTAASRAQSASRAMGADSLVTARKVRQPIVEKGDIENAFDGITYQKGAATLRMFEEWLGEAAFQKGVRRYLEDHRWGNAAAADFLSAISREGKPEVASAFATFLDQPGVPLVTVDLRCEDYKPPVLSLSQRRYLPEGSSGSSAQTWKIPICARWRSGKKESRACMLLEAASGEMPLGEVVGCPDWVLVNSGRDGYYRVSYSGDLLARLFKDGGAVLTLPEKLGTLGDVEALVRSGDLPMADALAFVPMFAGDPDRQLTAAAIGIAASIRSHLVPEALRPNYARFVDKMFGARAHELGWTARPGDDDETRLLRQSIVPMVADDGEDAALRADARRLALAWLDDRKAIDPDMVGSVLSVAALDGDRALFDRFRAEAKKTADRRDRTRLLAAMGSFRDPAILKDALSLLLTDEFDVREAGAILRGASDDKTREQAWGFLEQNFDAYVTRIPRESGSRLPSIVSGFCDPGHRAEAATFFKDRLNGFPGWERNLAQALERIDLCAAQKSAQEASVAKFLATY
ncbi:MAG TPA: M1 family metallopeptidase [Candidatus Sulfotelmatobacter sp.]|jgi:alanyl aminopeptidase|nr:M1 family metallopeptidase [Candidatus Sulfotelmatobacter sp.]